VLPGGLEARDRLSYVALVVRLTHSITFPSVRRTHVLVTEQMLQLADRSTGAVFVGCTLSDKSRKPKSPTLAAMHWPRNIE
jgi:hypothetical protein